jgi:hypothetical protein
MRPTRANSQTRLRARIAPAIARRRQRFEYSSSWGAGLVRRALRGREYLGSVQAIAK